MKTVIIIGAGFSGTVLAAQLLNQDIDNVRIVLINRSGLMGRGLAYGTNSASHLLNVPAGNMSAYPEQPDHFLSFCKDRSLDVTGASFVPRQLYGQYLSALLEQADNKNRGKIIFEQLNTEVRSIQHGTDHLEVSLEDGISLHADHVVLALGNFSPAAPYQLRKFLGSAWYMHDPWIAQEDQYALDADESVLLVGSGLTALDTVTELTQQGHRGPIYMISRRGLLPLPHRRKNIQTPVDSPLLEELLQCHPSVLNYSRILRKAIKLTNGDWRDIIAAIRPITNKLWLRLNTCERRRFLRHLQPYWDVHRHRVAPDSHDIFNAYCATQQVKSFAGRIRDVSIIEDRLLVNIRRRNSESIFSIEVSKIINCTGPNTNLELVKEPLITQLIDSKTALLDDLKLGLLVNDDLTLTNALQKGSATLSYIGPMLKAKYWEATAVPELRKYASDLAASLAAKLNS